MNPVTQESTEYKDKPIDMLHFRSFNQRRQNQKQRYSYGSKYKWQRHLKVKKTNKKLRLVMTLSKSFYKQHDKNLFLLEQVFPNTREKTTNIFSNIFRGRMSVLHCKK